MLVTHLIQEQVRQSLAEDISHGDLTASLIPSNATSKAILNVREDAVLCGQQWFNQSFIQLDNTVKIKWFANDGDKIKANQTICEINGLSRSILTSERSAINFLQTLSATATITAHYVQLLNNTDIHLLDTRKTIPGLRTAQKYAVKCGGAYNHRHGLYDGVLIKENHIIAAGSIKNAVYQAKQSISHGLKIEVEVETLDEVEQAIQAGADILLLDNMSIKMIEKAIKIRKKLVTPHILFEVSGNITEARLELLSKLKIDFISVGALTKHIQAIDFSLRFK